MFEVKKFNHQFRTHQFRTGIIFLHAHPLVVQCNVSSISVHPSRRSSVHPSRKSSVHPSRRSCNYEKYGQNKNWVIPTSPQKHFVCRGYKKILRFIFHDIFKQHNQGNLMRPTFTQTASHAVTVCRIFLIKFWAFCTRDLSAWNKYKTGRLHLREHPWKRQPSFEHVFLLCRIQK